MYYEGYWHAHGLTREPVGDSGWREASLRVDDFPVFVSAFALWSTCCFPVPPAPLRSPVHQHESSDGVRLPEAGRAHPRCRVRGGGAAGKRVVV